MDSDEAALRALNTEVAKAEDRGDSSWLAKIIAPTMAFRRANQDRSFDTREMYLEKVKPIKVGAEAKTTTIIDPILIYGDRAVVQCVVTVGSDSYHNLRLFVRVDGSWMLLGWANERI